MTDIIGTENADRLEGTAGNDTIKALGGNDIIIGSSGTDTVDGGDGNDTIDFSSVSGGAITLTNTGQGISRGFNRFGPPSPNALSTGLTSVETIIGNPNEKNTIADFSRYTPAGNMDVDLSAERLTFTSAANGNVSTYTVKNFANINAVNGTNRMKGNDLDNFIS